MLQRIIGHTVGAVVAFLLLVLFGAGAHIVSDANQGYVIAVVVGAFASFFWPIVIGWWLIRRHKERQQNQIDEAVAKSMADQNK
jgi:hypothetical protein